MERRELKAIVKAVKSENRTIEIVANSGQTDRMNEQLPAKALKSENYLKNPVVLWAHKYDELPVGKTLSLREEGDSLVASIQFAETDFAEDVWQLYKGDFLNAVSVGFVGKDYDGGKQGQPLIWKDAELLEISCVPVPADAQAIRRRIKMLELEDAEAKPYPNEHSCRLEDPGKYDRFARKNCEAKHEGKCIDFIYGVKEGKSELQAMRFPKDVWDEGEARAYCKEKDGTFEAASEEKRVSIRELLHEVADTADWIDAIVAKEGRVISKRNRELIQEVVSKLTELLGIEAPEEKAATVTDNDDDIVNEIEKLTKSIPNYKGE